MVALFLDDNKTNDDGDGRRKAKTKRFLFTKLPNFTRLLYGVGEHNTMQDLYSSWAKSSLVVQRRSVKDMGHIWLVQKGL